MGQMIEKVGHILKEARLQKHLELRDIAQILKIRRVYLEALEKGDITEIPGEVYIFGYLKEYAGFLDLDVDEVVYCYKQDDQFATYHDECHTDHYDETGIRRLVRIFMTFPIIAGTTIGAFHTKQPDYNLKADKPYTIHNQSFTLDRTINTK